MPDRLHHCLPLLQITPTRALGNDETPRRASEKKAARSEALSMHSRGARTRLRTIEVRNSTREPRPSLTWRR